MAILKENFYSLTPKDCLNLSFEQSFDMLERLIGKDSLKKAMNISEKFPSPLKNNVDTKWCKTAKIIGINPRLVKSYWGIVKYAMTFPEECIHLMPLWTTGDKGSLYVQTSWRLNDEFLDKDLVSSGFLDTNSQLKLVINILHAMGKIVGFDALAHVDNFSEITLLNPKFFEWAKLNEEKTAQLFYPEVDYNHIYKEVENSIITAIDAPENLFARSETDREKIMFLEGKNRDEIRYRIMQSIRKSGFEPLPVTEHSPCRPVVFEKIEKTQENDWAVFNVKNKSDRAKIIGCITPYKWYKTDNKGFPVKNAKEEKVWEYFADKINHFQKEYGFDFLRADMAHNQISHSHIEKVKDESGCEEFWAYLKNKITEEKPYFGVLAEAFYGNYYINGINDMINKKADIVLGDMNFKFLNREFVNWIDDFINPFRKNFPFYPCVCIFTNDADLPEHSKYYRSREANVLRYFISIFLNLPSYMGIGFETKNPTPQIENEFSNIYVKLQKNDFVFGEDIQLFEEITKIRYLYCKYKDRLADCELTILETDNENSVVWIYSKDSHPVLLFAVNFNPDKNEINFYPKTKHPVAKLVYTNSAYDEICKTLKNDNCIENIFIGEGTIYEF